MVNALWLHLTFTMIYRTESKSRLGLMTASDAISLRACIFF